MKQFIIRIVRGLVPMSSHAFKIAVSAIVLSCGLLTTQGIEAISDTQFSFVDDAVIVMPIFDEDTMNYDKDNIHIRRAEALAAELQKLGFPKVTALPATEKNYLYNKPQVALRLAMENYDAKVVICGVLASMEDFRVLYLAFENPKTKNHNLIAVALKTLGNADQPDYWKKVAEILAKKLTEASFIDCYSNNSQYMETQPLPIKEQKTILLSPPKLSEKYKFPKDPKKLRKFLKDNAFSLYFSADGFNLLHSIREDCDKNARRKNSKTLFSTLNSGYEIGPQIPFPRGWFLQDSVARGRKCYAWLTTENSTKHQLAIVDFDGAKLETLLTVTTPEIKTPGEYYTISTQGHFDVEYPYALGVLNGHAVVFNLAEKTAHVIKDLPFTAEGGTILNGEVFLRLVDAPPNDQSQSNYKTLLFACSLDGADRRILYNSRAEEKTQPLEKAATLSEKNFQNARLIANPYTNTVVIQGQEKLIEIDAKGEIVSTTAISSQGAGDDVIDDPYFYFSNGGNMSRYNLKTRELEFPFALAQSMSDALNVNPAYDATTRFPYIINTEANYFLSSEVIWNKNGLALFYGETPCTVNPAYPEKMEPLILPLPMYDVNIPNRAYLDPDQESFWIFAPDGTMTKIKCKEDAK